MSERPHEEPEQDDQQVAIDADVAAAAVESDVDLITKRVAELTNDLQRVQAECANYRKRVERDREAVRESAVASFLAELLPVLDDIGRARQHNELEGGFKSVGEALEQVTVRLGLERYGQQWDAFDPSIHEAIAHDQRDDIPEGLDGQVCSAVHQPGYRLGARVIRAAIVTVSER